jgi:hypothetical protein
MRSKNLFYLISDLVSDCYQSGTWQGSHGYQFFTGKVSFVNSWSPPRNLKFTPADPVSRHWIYPNLTSGTHAQIAATSPIFHNAAPFPRRTIKFHIFLVGRLAPSAPTIPRLCWILGSGGRISLFRLILVRISTLYPGVLVGICPDRKSPCELFKR